MGKRGPPARVVPDWIWEYVELHTVGQSQPVKIALINKLLIQNGEVPIKRSFYQDHVARRKAARCLALVVGEPSPSVAAHTGFGAAEDAAPSVAEGTSDEDTAHVDDGSASARHQFDLPPGSSEAIVTTTGADEGSHAAHRCTNRRMSPPHVCVHPCAGPGQSILTIGMGNCVNLCICRRIVTRSRPCECRITAAARLANRGRACHLPAA
jgi:hypothetical protein